MIMKLALSWLAIMLLAIIGNLILESRTNLKKGKKR